MTVNTSSRNALRIPALTLADLLDEVTRYGADPASVTFSTDLGPILADPDDYDLVRREGALVVLFPIGGEEEQEDEEWEEW
jgi:hypothetical protein